MEDTIVTTFQKFINDILMIPNITNDDNISKYYKSILDAETLCLDNCDIIKSFLEKINEYTDLIVDENIDVFNNDILPEIDFKSIMVNNKDNIVITKNIWKYLQTFNIMSINFNSSNELKLLLSGNDNKKKQKKKDINDLKKLKSLKEKITNNEDEINKVSSTNESNDESSEIDFSKIFNSNLGNLAQEIASDINIKDMIDNVNINSEDPSEIFKSIMNPDTFSGLFNSINNIVQTKMENNEINTDNIQKDAENMFPSFEKNPLLNSMLHNPNISNQVNNSIHSNKATDSSSNPTKKRLQKKLKQKQNQEQK